MSTNPFFWVVPVTAIIGVVLTLGSLIYWAVRGVLYLKEKVLP